MAVTAAQIAQLRRMVNEPAVTTYSDDLLTDIIEAYPCIDERGISPYYWDTTTTPPTKTTNTTWLETYDLNAAAGQIWDEKAAAVAGDYDINADGGSLNRSQVGDQYRKMARIYKSRRKAGTITQSVYPKPEDKGDLTMYGEDDD